MVFTPLLATACVGTLECRSVALPLIDIQPQLKAPQVDMLGAPHRYQGSQDPMSIILLNLAELARCGDITRVSLRDVERMHAH